MRESEKVESFRLALATPLSVFGRMSAKLQEPRLFRVQFQAEFCHPFLQFFPEPLGIRFELESNNGIIGEPNNDHVALRSLLPPYLNPKIKHVMKVDVRHQGRCTPALR